MLRTITLTLLLSTTAAAQVQEGPPSEQLANALRLYQREDYARAATAFADIRAGRSADGEGGRQRAEFFQAKCLYHLDRWQEALLHFDHTAQPTHLYFASSLMWLLQLWEHLAESPVIVSAVGRYPNDIIEQFDTNEQRVPYVRARYLLGRARVGQGRYQDALQLLAPVREDPAVGRDASAWYHRAISAVGPQ
jgi:hypothetical protein